MGVSVKVFPEIIAIGTMTGEDLLKYGGPV